MERLDELIIGGYRLWQDTETFRFSIDAILLGHFVPMKQGYRYADLGTGTGAIAHVLVGRGAHQVVAFEWEEKAVALAKRNVIENHLTEHITVEEGDYREAYRWQQGKYQGSFHGIVVNPPYFKKGYGAVSRDSGRAIALHEEETTLAEVAMAARRLLRFGGYFWMIYRADQLSYALRTLQEANLMPKRLRCIHSKPQTPAKLFLVEAKLGGREGMEVQAPLYIYDDKGDYTTEVAAWYRKEDNES